MKYIYERTAKYMKRASLTILIISILALLLFNDFWKDTELLFIIGFTTFLLFCTSIYFRNAAEKLPEELQPFTNESEAQLFSVHELNFQKDVSFIPLTYLVSSTGERLYKIEPSSEHRIIRMLSILSVFNKGTFLPIIYQLKTVDDLVIGQFTIKNKLKYIEMKVQGHIGEKISTIVLPPISVKNRAIVYNHNDEKILQTEAKGMYGDIDIDDPNGKRLASYRFGMFPYATHPAFELQGNNVHVKLASHLSKEEKLTFTALFYYWTADQK